MNRANADGRSTAAVRRFWGLELAPEESQADEGSGLGGQRGLGLHSRGLSDEADATMAESGWCGRGKRSMAIGGEGIWGVGNQGNAGRSAEQSEVVVGEAKELYLIYQSM